MNGEAWGREGASPTRMEEKPFMSTTGCCGFKRCRYKGMKERAAAFQESAYPAELQAGPKRSTINMMKWEGLLKAMIFSGYGYPEINGDNFYSDKELIKELYNYASNLGEERAKYCVE